MIEAGGSGRPAAGSGRVPGARTAGAFIAVVAGLFFMGAIVLQAALGEPGLLAAEWLLLFVPSALFVLVTRVDPIETLSLRRPRSRNVLGASVLAAGALPLIWVVAWLQTFVLPVPVDVLEGLEQLVTADSPTRLLWLLLMLAVTPAICEELVFRGVLLGSTKTLTPWRAILLNGVVFGAFHLSLSTVVRFLPTAVLGCLIAWAVWHVGSIWIGVVMHLVNNASIVFLASTPAIAESFADPGAPPPLAAVVVGGIAFAAGLRILLPTLPLERGDTGTSTLDP
ncbi:MAG: CPBP family intramembrane metalloprotease [Gemmatimonadota bacterium]|nr:CPBP family intramembrane metalloprotease [Gemmatimonadota bacterium]